MELPLTLVFCYRAGTLSSFTLYPHTKIVRLPGDEYMLVPDSVDAHSGPDPMPTDINIKTCINFNGY